MAKQLSRTLLFFIALLAAIGLTGVVDDVAAVEPALWLWQAPSEIEPNNTPAEANPIMINQTIVGTVPLANPSDIDYYVLDTEVGRRYQVRLAESPISGDYRFRLALYDATQDFLSEADTQAGSSVLEWTAADETYYLSVNQSQIQDVDATYEISVIRFPLTPTATSPAAWDDCEINDSLTGTWSTTVPPGGPCAASVGATLEDLNFVPFTGQPSPNPDYFFIAVKAGRTYEVETQVTPGVDTEMYLYPPGATDDSQYIEFNDDATGLGYGSRVRWTAQADGAYLVRILNREPLPHTSSETYDLVIEDVSPTATPTATTAATATPGTPAPTTTPILIPGMPDAFEPNYDFDRSALIGLGRKYTNLNFVPWTRTGQDNDFYKLWVVPGKLYTCETSDLGTAANTNIIFYSCPSQNCGFAGNDNVEPFDPNDPYRSRITFFSTYEGYLYLLIGQVGADRILPEEWSDLTYSLECFIEQPGTATPTPTSQFAPTPVPSATPAPVDTPVPGAPPASPTPARVIVRPMGTPAAPSPAAPLPTPTPQLYVIDLLLYYDANRNMQPDAGEGIRDVLARAYDAIAGDLLSVDYTDETGRLQFTVPGRGPVRVSVPFFGFDQIVTRPDADIQIRIAPSF